MRARCSPDPADGRRSCGDRDATCVPERERGGWKPAGGASTRRSRRSLRRMPSPSTASVLEQLRAHFEPCRGAARRGARAARAARLLGAALPRRGDELPLRPGGPGALPRPQVHYDKRVRLARPKLARVSRGAREGRILGIFQNYRRVSDRARAERAARRGAGEPLGFDSYWRPSHTSPTTRVSGQPPTAVLARGRTRSRLARRGDRAVERSAARRREGALLDHLSRPRDLGLGRASRGSSTPLGIDMTRRDRFDEGSR